MDMGRPAVVAMIGMNTGKDGEASVKALVGSLALTARHLGR
jgi:hypothetical protein